jgi:hypothetical protein
MIESEADRLMYLQAFGVSVSSDRGDLVGIFDAEYVSPGDIEDAAPMLECRESDVRRLSLAKGSVLQINSATYRVRRHEPDGTGMSRLILEQ